MRPAAACSIAYGIVSMGAQVLVLRALTAALGGAEIGYGSVLAHWLLWTAAGAALGGWWRSGWTARHGAARFTAVLAMATPVAVGAAAHCRGALFPRLAPGEILSVAQMLLLPAPVLAPLGVLSGLAFSWCLRWVREESPPGGGPARAYGLVAVGDLVAGAVLSTTWATEQPSLAVGLALSGLAPLALGLGARSRAAGGLDRPLATAGAAAAIASALLFPHIGALEVAAAQSAVGPELPVVAVVHSVHGTIIAARRGQQTSLFQHGGLVCSTPNPEQAEELHYILLTRESRGSEMLLVGGVLSGELAEALKHDPARVDAVELDPRLITAARRAGAPEPPLDDPRVRFHTGDGRLFLRTVDRSWDYVILTVPPPVTLAGNRYFTLEFLTEVRRHFRPGGIVAVSIPGNASYLGDAGAALGGCVLATMRAVYEEVVVLPGSPMFLLGRSGGEPLVYERSAIARRLAERGITNEFVVPSVVEWSDRLDPYRIGDTRARLEEYVGRLNRDFDPVACERAQAYMSTLTERGGAIGTVAAALSSAREVPLWAGLGGAVALALCAWVLGRSRGGAGALPLLLLGSVGFAGLVGELVVLLGYQSLYGYVYQRIGLILGVFMAGTALGSWGLPAVYRCVRWAAAAAAVDLAITVAATPWAVQWAFARGTGLGEVTALAAALLIGVFVGAAYPLACEQRAADRASPPREHGAAEYAADLLGASAGAFLGAVVLIPTRGMGGAALAAAILVLAWVPGLIRLARSRS